MSSVGALQRASLTDLRSETSKYPILVSRQLHRDCEAHDAEVLRRPPVVRWREGAVRPTSTAKPAKRTRASCL
jgi:hypothetical protein